MKLHLPAGSAAAGDDPLLVTPEAAGWQRSGLRVVRLAPGTSRVLASGTDEIAVLPLSGGGCTVEVEGRRFELAGRESVFARITDWAYVPIDAELRISSTAGCELALASARASRRFDPAYVEAGDIPVELRGAGQSTRQLANFMVPEVFDGADKLICCEVLTPDGNWSSYPPHKHDEQDLPRETRLEELYYYRFQRPSGFAFQRVYTADRSLDEALTPMDGDLVLVPRGYHAVGVPAGYECYYLNVMAGPVREWRFTLDPDHAWLMDWSPQAADD